MKSLDDVFTEDALNDAAPAIFDLWQGYIRTAFKEAVKEREAELRGTIADWRKHGGWDVYSRLTGAIGACESLFPELVYANASMTAIRAEARSEAEEKWRKKNALGEALVA